MGVNIQRLPGLHSFEVWGLTIFSLSFVPIWFFFFLRSSIALLFVIPIVAVAVAGVVAAIGTVDTYCDITV